LLPLSESLFRFHIGHRYGEIIADGIRAELARRKELETERKENGMKRPTNRDKAEASGVVPRLYNEAEAAIYLGMSVSTLQHLRMRTPERYTRETWLAELKKGRIMPPPFVKQGKDISYDSRDMDMYIDMLPRMVSIGSQNRPIIGIEK
jgi:hypothetical protein